MAEACARYARVVKRRRARSAKLVRTLYAHSGEEFFARRGLGARAWELGVGARAEVVRARGGRSCAPLWRMEGDIVRAAYMLRQGWASARTEEGRVCGLREVACLMKGATPCRARMQVAQCATCARRVLGPVCMA